MGIWDQAPTIAEINPNDYTMSVSNNCFSSAPKVKSDLVNRAHTHYLEKASKYCKEAILASSYPGLRVSLQEFIKDFVTYSSKLRQEEIDPNQSKNKQKALAKHILQKKRLALSDYFKTLLGMGISHRIGTLAWKNKLEEVLDFTIPPLELSAAINNLMKVGTIEKSILDQWKGCEKYIIFLF